MMPLQLPCSLRVSASLPLLRPLMAAAAAASAAVSPAALHNLGRADSPTGLVALSFTSPTSMKGRTLMTIKRTTTTTALEVTRPFSQLLAASSPRRGPKQKGGKKGGGGGASAQQQTGAGSGAAVPPGADHVFNIYSTIKEDHVLLPEECYPDWLWELEKPEKSYGELAMMFLYGQVCGEEINVFSSTRPSKNGSHFLIE